MAPVLVKDVVVFSSEDPRFPAQNLLIEQKWLTNAKDTTGKATIEFQLDRAAYIHYVDIGHYNVASIEISVGRSSWAPSHDYAILLPTVMLQTPLEARAGKNKSGCKMYKYPEHFSAEHAKEKWDRVRIRLNQPFLRNKQMGLEFARFVSPGNANVTMPVMKMENSQTPDDFTAATWKNSSIGKLAKSLNRKSEGPCDLEDKLLRISSTTEDGSAEKSTLSRTAKMVLSSRLKVTGTPEAQRKLPPSTPTGRKVKGTLCGLTSATSPVNRRHQESPVTKTPNRRASKDNPRSLTGRGKPKCTTPKNGTQNSSSIPLATEKLLSKDTPSSSSYKFKRTNILGTSSCRISDDRHSSDISSPNNGGVIGSSGAGDTWPGPSSSNGSSRGNVSSGTSQYSRGSSGSGCASDIPSTSADTACDVIEKKTEDALSKEEIKHMKKLIQRFFNTINMEELDPDNVTLRELLMSFEALNDVSLDSDGREYFKSVTASYVELAKTCREHKKKGEEDQHERPTDATHASPARKRKSSERATSSSYLSHTVQVHSSPAKMRRTSPSHSRNEDCEIVSINNGNAAVQCPLCMEMFPRDIVSDHAAVCGEEDVVEAIGNTPTSSSDVEITSVFTPQRSQVQSFPGETILDLSDNMRLTEEEKKYWINFTKQPKPFHPRMDKDLFRGSKLVKCPTCGQFYKSEEIQEHSDECAEKVNSGCERRGLYYVKKKTGKIVKNV